MGSQVPLDDLLIAHDGINSIIKQLYPNSHQREEEEGKDDEDGEKNVKSEVECKVGRFVEAVTELEKTREVLTATLGNTLYAKLNQTSTELTDPVLLGRRVSWCVEAEQHMRSIIENKDLLIYHLQQPLVTTFLTMHHKHHRSLVSLVGSLCDLLNRLQSHIDLIEQHSRHSALNTTDSVISSLARVVAGQRDVLSDITSLQNTVAAVL